jgi:hypothetical protein
MTERPSSNDSTGNHPSDSSSAVSESEYKVGPGRPPKEHQFKPGQSGNPKGAKRKAPSLAPDLKKLLAQALDKKVTITQGEKRRTLTLFAAGLEQLVRQFVKGDRHARKDLFALAEQVGLDLLGLQKKALEAALTPNQEAMLYDFVAKQYDKVTPRAPVLAPPELLDDGVDDQAGGSTHA